ncbi:hypothetical protein, conserved in T. vivax [Trypanosoma vivax Y486]|uniref:Uncharacterized protein n=1 Tax=Trypanosoma vivax (strain Y486) TaxID=1055687 RepID=F9WTX9_TRYVY|nr:hypothetical protein, conserved in T. vivax [Trypanosoma vivax Y486]|eukprot:CCD21025.1 hypothetical protein, conserved in T. vivax [Trypanosoma vivax Y486]
MPRAERRAAQVAQERAAHFAAPCSRLPSEGPTPQHEHGRKKRVGRGVWCPWRPPRSRALKVLRHLCARLFARFSACGVASAAASPLFLQSCSKMGGGMLGARRLAAWFGVFALAMCIRTAIANSEGRGLKLELAKELCAQSIFLRGVAQAARNASDEARKQAGAAREKQAMVLRVWQATGNASLARLAEEANTVAALADAVTGAVTRIIERATRHAWRISDFIATFGSVSGAVTGTGKLCIGKTEGTGGGAENAANDGNTAYVLASHLEDCGADESAVKKVVAIVKPTKNTFTVSGVGPEAILNGRKYADMLTYRAIVDRSDLAGRCDDK